MSFRINTNVHALNAIAIGNMNMSVMSDSLQKLSSGLRINKASDDASGMQIADSLMNQAHSLGQAIKNSHDALGIIQIADKAMDEQILIMNTIKVKATQSAQDGQTTETRQAIQADIDRLIESLDNIAGTTSFNGQQLLSGAFTNKEFQIGAYSNTTVGTSIHATSSDKIGHARFETTGHIKVSSGASSFGKVGLKFIDVDGKSDFQLESVVISTSAGTGIGVLSDTINKNSDSLKVRSNWNVTGTGANAVASGSIENLSINGITIGTISGIMKNDGDGRLLAAINKVKDRTGVEGSVDDKGRLNIKSIDGRAIEIRTGTGGENILGGGSFTSVSNAAASHAIIGRLTLTRLNARDIVVSGTNYGHVGLISNASGSIGKMAQGTVNLRSVRGEFTSNVACAAGNNANESQAMDTYSSAGIGTGVTSLRGAMMVMDITDSALRTLGAIRSDLGSSIYNKVTSILSNIMITQANVKSAESTIRDVDFAQESSRFSRQNILIQSGNFALTQANVTQENILTLLQ